MFLLGLRFCVCCMGFAGGFGFGWSCVGLSGCVDVAVDACLGLI